ncbi:hypothetical protein COCSUDRAFT_65140 [Coccomyxa subellipsoidea C-169]|uniref:Golgi to ER traffic protein 4 n=1 Tax=Coccomyxa subellipsoidea (strain C-169) TaxID=574566 RepID=I0Z3G3_COCSC|nr:hypothetical protein COCSUDRAFT_65140 [Coccomyxa subellipsoidea C-169]EIE25182.1 hypothetical protein COCSUDRAFT_65140 [Coccomyxa subellipsoidea C-169]|eukprot:XP_005649726.1 hypothetical protein COCSUDRAFT_65140 [Coccomyxa subellipsoidea C-169]
MSVNKILSRIENATTTEAAYEAQQMLKTVYHRLRSRKKLTESYDLLQQGARLQLKGDQLTCGSELALLLIHDLEADGFKLSELHRITDLLECIRKPYTESRDSPEIKEATKITSAAIRWVKKMGDEEAAKKLHSTLAALICKCQGAEGLLAASEHFSRGDDPAAFAAYLADVSSKGSHSEHDLILTRAVLQVLAVGRASQLDMQLAFARELMGGFSNRTASAAASISTPLTHFLEFLLQALDGRSLSLLELLQKEYSHSLARDPDLGEMLETVKQTYFPSMGGQGMSSLLGNIFQMISTAEPPA